MDKQKEALDTYIGLQQNKINELVQHIMMLESKIKILENDNQNLKKQNEILKIENNINKNEIKSIKQTRKTFSSVNGVTNTRTHITEEKNVNKFNTLTQFKPK